MKGLAVVIALEAVAFAQPQPDAEPVPAEPGPVEPAPSQPAPSTTTLPTAPPGAPPGSIAPRAQTTRAGHDMAVRMTRAAHDAGAHDKCDLVEQLGARVRQLDAAYYDQVFASDSAIAPCLPHDTPPRPVSVARRSVLPSWLTLEAAIGAAAEVGGGLILGGPALGIGGFVSPNVALSLRLSGANFFFVYLGVLGPHAQVWLSDNTFVGGGVGLGFFAGCFDGCGRGAGFGADARLGYAFRPRGQSGANISIESAYQALRGGEFDHYQSFDSIAVMIGYQTF